MKTTVKTMTVSKVITTSRMKTYGMFHNPMVLGSFCLHLTNLSHKSPSPPPLGLFPCLVTFWWLPLPIHHERLVSSGNVRMREDHESRNSCEHHVPSYALPVHYVCLKNWYGFLLWSIHFDCLVNLPMTEAPAIMVKRVLSTSFSSPSGWITCHIFWKFKIHKAPFSSQL